MMTLNPPPAWAFWLSVVLVVVAIVLGLARVDYAEWIGVIGYIVLALGCAVKTPTSGPI
jgi:hypothetical protein